MTTQYPAPAEPEPYSFADAVALIVATADDEKLPFPRGLRDNRPGTQLLVLDCADEAQAHAWAPVFDAHQSMDGHPFCTKPLAWHGWTVAMWFDKPATVPAQDSGSGGIEPSSPPPDPVTTQPAPALCAVAQDPPRYNTAPCDGPAVWQVTYYIVADREGPIRQVAPVCYRHAYNEVRWTNMRKFPEQAEMRAIPRSVAAAVLTPDATL